MGIFKNGRLYVWWNREGLHTTPPTYAKYTSGYNMIQYEPSRLWILVVYKDVNASNKEKEPKTQNFTDFGEAFDYVCNMSN